MANLLQSFKTDIAHVSDMKKTSSGDIQSITGLENYKSAIYHRLITVPGSLVHKPNYGVGILLYENAPSSFSTQQELASKIKDQVSQDPRTQSFGGVSFVSGDTPRTTKIIIRVTPIGYTEQVIEFTPFSGANT